ncbi:MAG: DUF2934 domain-containing protein [Candidatus Omnitrophota bacterium]|nr:MAG: DUF2934 domain-containing protein [Candidatus Omnitrophota bacterium]
MKSHPDKATLSQMIQKRAYFIWEERGKPYGSDIDIWIQAERDILSHVKK